MTDKIPDIGWPDREGLIRLLDSGGEMVFAVSGVILVPLQAVEECVRHGWEACGTFGAVASVRRGAA